jgi:hypothetical protein
MSNRPAPRWPLKPPPHQRIAEVALHGTNFKTQSPGLSWKQST